MKVNTAIRVSYWAEQEGLKIIEPVGIDAFRDELAQSYVSLVRGRPGDLGGGLYELAIEFISNISIKDAVAFIGSGVGFDLLKAGTKSFLWKPLLSACETLRKKNTALDIDIHELKFIFNDAEVIVGKICSGSIYDSLGEIFQALADNYEHLKNRDGEYPFTIQIPVLEDPDGTLCRFRVLLDVDEIIENVTRANYLNYWGIDYELERASRVFDLKKKLLIDEEFLTLERYWQKWDIALAAGKL